MLSYYMQLVAECPIHVLQTESTLWRLKFFVKDTLEVQAKSSTSIGANNNDNTNNHNSGNKTNKLNNANNKRKREICNAIAKTNKKNKKPSSWSCHAVGGGI